jgi:hypothetical protein
MPDGELVSKLLWFGLWTVAEAWWLSDLVLGVTRRGRRPHLARLIHRALGPAYLPCVFGAVALDILTGKVHGPLDMLGDGIWAATAVWIWIGREKDDDDDWKRLLHRIAGRVKSLGHRLTVAPEGSPA